MAITNLFAQIAAPTTRDPTNIVAEMDALPIAATEAQIDALVAMGGIGGEVPQPPAVPFSAEALTDAELTAYPVPLRKYGEHSVEERAVLIERQRRRTAQDERDMAARGFPIGGRVRVAESYRRRFTNGHWAGREGIIVRSAMDGDYAYVHLDPSPRERTVKVEMFSTGDLEPITASLPAITTSGTQIHWRNVADWLRGAQAILDRRITSKRALDIANHTQALTKERIDGEMDPTALRGLIRFIETQRGGGAFNQRHRGQREGDRPTDLLVWANNRAEKLERLAVGKEFPLSRQDAAPVESTQGVDIVTIRPAQLARVEAFIGPGNGAACYSVRIVIDGQDRTGLEFAGHRGYWYGKRTAQTAARAERKAAAAALTAYEAEHGPWRPIYEAKRTAQAEAFRPAFEETVAAFCQRVAVARPWNGRGLPTPAQMIRWSQDRDVTDQDKGHDLAEQRDAAQPQEAPPGARVLILPCSATKRPDPAPMPARSRYIGPLWQTYRATVAQIGTAPRTAVLSAEFGILEVDAHIPDYERRLDPVRSAELAADPAQLDRLAAALHGAMEVYVTGGAMYRATVAAMLRQLQEAGRVPNSLRVIAPTGLGIGQQRAALRHWMSTSVQCEENQMDDANQIAGGAMNCGDDLAPVIYQRWTAAVLPSANRPHCQRTKTLNRRPAVFRRCAAPHGRRMLRIFPATAPPSSCRAA
jgi:hypothetical protein